MVQWSRFQVHAFWNVASRGQVERCSDGHTSYPGRPKLKEAGAQGFNLRKGMPGYTFPATHTSCPTQADLILLHSTLLCFADNLFLKNLKVHGNPVSSKSTGTVFPTVLFFNLVVYIFFFSHIQLWELNRNEGGCCRIEAFELWCWRRLLRVPWTARRSNQSILREINPEYLLEGLMLMLKLQYFGHLTRTADSLEKFLMLGKIEGRRRRGHQRIRWLDGITDAMDVNLGKLQ